MKKVTVIIPCFNSEKYVSETIESVLKQTYKNIEIIAVDNESTDSTISILQKYKKDIKIRNAPNIWKYSWDEARDVGLKEASGEYIQILSSDDILEEKFVENNILILEKIPGEIKFLQSPIKGFSSAGERGIIHHYYESLDEFKNLCLQKCPVNTPTVFFSRGVVELGLLSSKPEEYSGACDYDLWCQLADKGHYIYPSPKYLGYKYRWHEDQCTWGMHKDFSDVSQRIRDYWRKEWKK